MGMVWELTHELFGSGAYPIDQNYNYIVAGSAELNLPKQGWITAAGWLYWQLLLHKTLVQLHCWAMPLQNGNTIVAKMTVWLIAFYLLNWNAWTYISYSNLELSELQPGEQTQGNRKWSGKHVTIHCGNNIVRVTIHLPPHDFLAAVSCGYHNDTCTRNEYIPLLGELQLTLPCKFATMVFL